jgi:hypothetical protein
MIDRVRELEQTIEDLRTSNIKMFDIVSQLSAQMGIHDLHLGVPQYRPDLDDNNG